MTAQEIFAKSMVTYDKSYSSNDSFYYKLPYKKDFIGQLISVHPEITTIIQCVNNKRTSMVLSDRFNILYGKGYIEDKLNGLTFRISPSAFYQVNSNQTPILYNKAIDLAQLNKDDIVIDAYC